MFEFMATVIILLLAIPLALFLLIGFYCAYAALRFVKNKPGENVVDQTAGYLSFFFVIWACASQRVLVAEKLPFVKKDLMEWLKVRKDDGKDGQ